MSKRFTETDKWKSPKFRALSVEAKILWHYLLDNCDHAGVIYLDLPLAEFQIGTSLTDAFEELGPDLIEMEKKGRWLIPKFIQFQYGKLSKTCKPHNPVFVALRKHGLDPDDMPQNEFYTESVRSNLRDAILKRDGLICVYSGESIKLEEAVIDHIIPKAKGGQAMPDNLVVSSRKMNAEKSDLTVAEFCSKASIDYLEVKDRLIERIQKPCMNSLTGKPFQRVQDKTRQEEDKDKEEDKKRKRKEPPIWDPTPVQLRINSLFGRRASTKWSDAELKACKGFEPSEEDLYLMGWFFRQNLPEDGPVKQRLGIAALLNNWPGEVDKARNWHSKKTDPVYTNPTIL